MLRPGTAKSPVRSARAPAAGQEALLSYWHPKSRRELTRPSPGASLFPLVLAARTTRCALAAAAAVAVCLGARLDVAGAAAGKEVSVLSTRGFWRYHETVQTDVARVAGGELIRVDPFRPRDAVAQDGKKTRYKVRATRAVLGTAFPPAGWMRNDFDDSRWGRRAGHFLSPYTERALLCLRGKFRVPDPAKAGELRVSLAFRGGAVVYLNGRELARSALPEGDLAPETLAADYPAEAFLNPAGRMIARPRWGRAHSTFPDRYALRTRRIDGVRIPPAMLRQGVNVLAVEIHRAPAIEAMFVQFPERMAYFPDVDARRLWWNRAGLESLSLVAPAGTTVLGSVRRPEGVQVWQRSTLRKIYPTEYGHPCEPPGTVRLHGPRNGVCAGQVMVGAAAPLKGVEAKVSDLKAAGGAAMPSSAAAVRYPRQVDVGNRRVPFDALEARPAAGAAVQPVWLTVKVPRAARPGRYSGTLTVRAEGAEPVAVPIRLRVFDWVVCDPTDFRTHVGLIESPESVAMKYGVDLWSEKHWRLVDESFRLMGLVGAKTAYLPLIRRTHFGNDHTMVRWIRRPDGSWGHDFRIVERYLDMAVRRLGKVPVVCLYCWEPFTNVTHRGRLREGAKGMLFTERDPASGALKAAEGPRWDDPKIVEFWRPVLDGIRRRLKERGLEESMMFGLAGDVEPDRHVLSAIRAVVEKPRWVVHSHIYREEVGWYRGRTPHCQPVGYLAAVGGAIGVFWDPDDDRPFYGWQNPFRVVTFPRDWYGRGVPFRQSGRLGVYRLCAEGALLSGRLPKSRDAPLKDVRTVRKDVVSMGRHRDFKGFAGLRGFGRVGADFWGVLKGARGYKALNGRYPESQWGTVEIGHEGAMRYLIAPGADGPVSTIRLELMREALQEAEARIAVQDALLDEARRRRLGKALADRCRAVLDERTRELRRISSYYGQGTYLMTPAWQQRSESLYEAAEAVAARLGK